MDGAPGMDTTMRSTATSCPKNVDGFLSARSQFDSAHGVDVYAPTCCQSATFGPLFAFYCPLFFYEKIH